MSSTAALSLHKVSIRHDEREEWTPDSVTFSVCRGEVVLILGPSGCGKSTLTLAMNGLIPHAIPATLRGAVTVSGTDTSQQSVAGLSTHVAMVFQDPDAQIVTATVLDEVCFGPENLLVSAEEVLVRAERALRQVGLWSRRDDNPDRLSGGGKQRLAIACALALEAELLVLDEPTANLDPLGIDEVYKSLRTLARTQPDRAIVLVEHNLDAAIDIVDRVVVLDHSGRLAYDGATREVLQKNAEALHSLGVWLPAVTLAALGLRRAGVVLDPLPLTPSEFTLALEQHRVPEHPSVRVSKTGMAAETGEPDRPLIEVRNLTLTRGTVTVLRNVDLDVYAGDFIALIGTNGAGKTSLVQALAGVVPPPHGHVRVGDLDPGRARVRDLAERIGFVFQNPEHQFLTGSVYEELAHGLRIRHVDQDAVGRQVSEMLHRSGLEHVAGVHPFLLSGGQKRRLSVGSALITNAQILVLDEPTFGQDRARASELLSLLDSLRQAGTTVIVVTHDLQLVSDYANRVAVLSDGELLAVDFTETVLTDAALLARAGLRLPPLARALNGLSRHQLWRSFVQMHGPRSQSTRTSADIDA